MSSKKFVFKNPLKVLFIMTLFLLFSNTCHSETCLESNEIIFNALNLSKEQIENFDSIKKNKRIFSRTERNKYKLIMKLNKKDSKTSKHKKDYSKSNPKMTNFGNPQKCKCNTK